MKKNNKNRLISLRLNNFASFREEEFIEFDGRDPIYMVVGHNASGKTNLLRSLAFLEWLLIHTFEVDKDKELPCDKFLFSKKTLDEPTKIEVEYISSGNHYLYSTRLDKKKILFEELDQRLVVNKNHSWVKKFSREWNEEKKSYKVDCKSFGLSKEFVGTVKNVSGSFLAVTRKLNTHEPTNQATELWHKLLPMFSITEKTIRPLKKLLSIIVRLLNY
jgi:AAA15 family ATPase/GTPase